MNCEEWKLSRITQRKVTLGWPVVKRFVHLFEAYWKIPEGAQVGQPIKLMKFQRQFILDFSDNPHGTSRAYLSIARKNLKSVLIAGVVLPKLLAQRLHRTARSFLVRGRVIQRVWFSNLLKRWSGCLTNYQWLCESYQVRRCSSVWFATSNTRQCL